MFRLHQPCPNCASPYSFKNGMSLDTNTNKFIKLVEESPISGNIDGPEGGFDAIMQSIVCRDEIGWRRDARHLLIVTTDAGFHHAVDGRVSFNLTTYESYYLLIDNLICFFFLNNQYVISLQV